MIPNIFSLLGESIVGKHIAKGIIFSNSPKKFHPNGSRIQVTVYFSSSTGYSTAVFHTRIVFPGNILGRISFQIDLHAGSILLPFQLYKSVVKKDDLSCQVEPQSKAFCFLCVASSVKALEDL